MPSDLGLAALDRLDAHAMLERKGDMVRATGRVSASLTQCCVVTGDPIAAHVDEPFDLTFTPDLAVTEPEAEIELGPEDCDTIFHDGAAIDLGRAIVDTLALSIDPFPRSAGADAALKEAGNHDRRAKPARSPRLPALEGPRQRRLGALKRNVVVEVGVERRWLRARLGAGRTAAARSHRRHNRRSRSP